MAHASPADIDREIPRDQPPSVAQPLAKRVVCPICMIAVPLDPAQSIYEACCGKIVCKGCIVAFLRVTIDKTLLKRMKEEGRSKSELERAEFQLLMQKNNPPCAFCRSERPTSHKEQLKRLQKRVEKFDDPLAMNNLGAFYRDGTNGLRQNMTKAMALFERSFELGSPDAAAHLSYHNAHNQALKLKYMKEGARRGQIDLSAELGFGGLQNGLVNFEYAKKLVMRAAEAGDDEATSLCWEAFKSAGHLTKQELEATLRGKQATLDEVNNDDRAFAKRYAEFCQRAGVPI